MEQQRKERPEYAFRGETPMDTMDFTKHRLESETDFQQNDTQWLLTAAGSTDNCLPDMTDDILRYAVTEIFSTILSIMTFHRDSYNDPEVFDRIREHCIKAPNIFINPIGTTNKDITPDQINEHNCDWFVAVVVDPLRFAFLSEKQQKDLIQWAFDAQDNYRDV